MNCEFKKWNDSVHRNLTEQLTVLAQLLHANVADKI